MAAKDRFRFKRHDNIGSTEAESDTQFLLDRKCFVDSGYIGVLKNTADRRSIILGRTGAGKSAILEVMKQDKRALEINPRSLSIEYLSESETFQFVSQIGVNLDTVFQFIWRHLFFVEIVKEKYKISSENAKNSVIKKTWASLFGKTDRFRTIEMLENWGGSFWENAGSRLREISNRFEGEIATGLRIGEKDKSSFYFDYKNKFSDKRREEVKNQIQRTAAKIHASTLREIFDLLNVILKNDSQKPFYILIDDLDRQWADDEIRYRLIRALIDTVKAFQAVENAKVIIALRQDLMESVLKRVKIPGAQTTKIRSFCTDLIWTKQDLVKVMELRINALIEQTYTKKKVQLTDVLSGKTSKLSNADGIDYILDRSLFRPRDVITFLNFCIGKLEGKPTISADSLVKSESEYSHERLEALVEEWAIEHPTLEIVKSLLSHRRETFAGVELTASNLREVWFMLASDAEGQATNRYDLDIIWLVMNGYFADDIGKIDFVRSTILSVFYKVGLVSLKLARKGRAQIAHLDRREISAVEIGKDVKIKVLPIFWGALATRR